MAKTPMTFTDKEHDLYQELVRTGGGPDLRWSREWARLRSKGVVENAAEAGHPIKPVNLKKPEDLDIKVRPSQPRSRNGALKAAAKTPHLDPISINTLRDYVRDYDEARERILREETEKLNRQVGERQARVATATHKDLRNAVQDLQDALKGLEVLPDALPSKVKAALHTKKNYTRINALIET